MVRVTSSTMVSGSQLYSYLDIEGRGTNATASYYDLRGGVTSGYYWDLTCSSFLKWWENGVGHDIDSGSGHYGGYSDLQLVSSDSFAVTRTSSDRYITFECYSTSSLGSGSASYTVEVPHLPGAPTNLTATRISDNRIDLSWTNPSLPYGGFYLQVSIDGGSWSSAWSVENVMPTSYSYTAASAGHSYKFRAYTGHWYAFSAYSNETATISMTPSAPQSISVAASGGTNVTVTLSNNSAVATSLEYQTSTNGGSTWSASTTVSGSPVTSFSTSVSGTALIRVRNKNATGVSAWLVSDPITTICPPAPPTLRTPSGSVYDMALGDIEFSWLHNSLDGSAQTAYQLRYAINGGAWTTLSGTTAQSRTVSLGTFSVGNAVTWQVRTKGADANYSDWSQTGAFSIYTAPTVSITSPGATITGMPIVMTATYSDMAGFTCQAATVSLTQNGRTLFSEAATINGSAITSSLDVSEFLPTNGETYTVVLTARSSSGLQTTANATFLVDFTEPSDGALEITNDPETGYVSLLATFDNSVLHGENLTPFFSHDLTDGGYWSSTNSSSQAAGTQLEDGWAHFELTANMSFNLKTAGMDLKPSTAYTLLCEARNCTVSSDTSFAVINSMNSWETAESVAITGDGTYLLHVTTRDTLRNTIAQRIVTAGFTGDLRVSLYEGEYTGGYQPYVEYVEAASISVSRVNPDGSLTPIIAEGESGAGAVDRYAPLNTDYQYAVTTKAASQAVKTVYVTNRIDSLYWFAYWGENIAKAKWNPDNGGTQVTRPQKTRVYYAGRRDPVSYDGHAVALTETPSWMFIGKDEVEPFVQLIEDGGRGIYKSCDGWVYHADFDLTLTPSYTAIGYYGGASLGITRIAGDRL